jgi:hypothetical protein
MLHGSSYLSGIFQVFIAVSYSAACRVERESGYREVLETIVGDLERRGLRSYLAPLEEQWGAMRPERGIGIQRDLKALDESTVFVLFLDGNDSDGALVEFGMAVSLRKRIFVVVRRREEIDGYLKGVVDLGLAEIFHLAETETSLLAMRVEDVLCSQVLRRTNDS